MHTHTLPITVHPSTHVMLRKSGHAIPKLFHFSQTERAAFRSSSVVCSNWYIEVPYSQLQEAQNGFSAHALYLSITGESHKSFMNTKDRRMSTNGDLQLWAWISTRKPSRNRLSFTGTHGTPSFRVPLSTMDWAIASRRLLFSGTSMTVRFHPTLFFDLGLRTTSEPGMLEFNVRA